MAFKHPDEAAANAIEPDALDILDRLAAIYNNISGGAQRTDKSEKTLEALESLMYDMVQELRPVEPQEPAPTKEAA